MSDFKVDSLADLNSHPIEGFALQGGMAFSVPLYSQIDGNLWTGGCPVGVVPRDFSFIVCLYPWESYKRHDHQTYLEARLYDSSQMPDARALYALADYVNAVAAIGPTLVHCQAGLNRSGLVAALALVRRGMTPDAAISLLREKRCTAALCNRTFETWLRKQAA